MKTYPTILGPSKAPKKPCIAFYKYDGSNLRWEWQRKRGWHKFGTRRRLFDHTDEQFKDAIPLFFETQADQILAVVKKKYRDAQKVIVFTEYVGPNSFAGQHEPGDEMKLVLFDVNIHTKGLVGPREFLKNFGRLENVAEVVYEGNLNEQFIDDIRHSRYPVNEGVVCKGGSGHNLWMRKIKTLKYYKRLKESFGEKWKEYWE